MALFGCLIPGCPVLTDFTQINETKWSVPLGNAPESIVVFLTGVQPVPAGFAIGVYVSRIGDAVYEYVGCLTNECPSSVFRVPSSFLSVASASPVALGLSLETLDTVRNLGVTNSQPLEQTRAATYIAIAERITNDLHTFVCSYAKVLSSDPSDPQSEEIIYMPARWADTWKQRLLTRIQKDAAFWTS